jgi:hypothetical protein
MNHGVLPVNIQRMSLNWSVTEQVQLSCRNTPNCWLHVSLCFVLTSLSVYLTKRLTFLCLPVSICWLLTSVDKNGHLLHYKWLPAVWVYSRLRTHNAVMFCGVTTATNTGGGKIPVSRSMFHENYFRERACCWQIHLSVERPLPAEFNIISRSIITILLYIKDGQTRLAHHS